MSEKEIIVVMADWCPVCLEYKVIVNILQHKYDFKFRFMWADKVNVSAIPATVFTRGEEKVVVYGFMSCTDFLNTYDKIMYDRSN